VGDRLDGRAQLAGIVDALLEQIAAPLRSRFEQLEPVARLRVLREDHDTEARMMLAQPVGDANALAVTGRRHPHVGHDDVGLLLRDRGQERVAIGAARHGLDAVQAFQDGLQGLAHEERVVRVDDADRAVRDLIGRRHCSTVSSAFAHTLGVFRTGWHARGKERMLCRP